MTSNIASKSDLKDSHLIVTQEKALRNFIKKYKKIAVAYSGGVDSTLVAKIATEEKKNNDIICFIANSPSLPRRELKEAISLAQKHNFNLKIINTQEHKQKNYLKNNRDRCFFCKNELYQLLNQIKNTSKLDIIFDGTNSDDLYDFRPGMRAAQKYHVISPLAEIKIDKNSIRKLAFKLGLENWNKPSAPCLASRLPFGEKVSLKKLSQIEKAEDILFSLGFLNFRVRYYNNLAKIETDPQDFSLIIKHRTLIIDKFKTIGFNSIALDIEGFQSGKLTRIL